MDHDISKRKSTEEIISRLGIKDFYRQPGVFSKQYGCSKAHSNVMTNNNIKTPFLLLEDDVLLTDLNKVEFEIPDDADALYLGISSWGRYLNCSGPFVHYKEVAPNILRVFNMLATHAVLYLSQGYRETCSRICDFWCSNPLHSGNMDLGYAEIHKYFNIYSLDKPLFAQSSSLKDTNCQLTHIGINIDYSERLFSNTSYDLNKLTGKKLPSGHISAYHPIRLI